MSIIPALPDERDSSCAPGDVIGIALARVPIRLATFQALRRMLDTMTIRRAAVLYDKADIEVESL